MNMTLNSGSGASVHAGTAASDATSSSASATALPEDTKLVSVLDRVQRTGVLRVGYNRTTIPFTYDNAVGEPVGFDIESAHALAASLNVELKLVPFEWTSFDDLLASGEIDIAAAGIYVTDSRLEQFLISDPYLESPLALIVPSERYQDYLSRMSVAADPTRQITVFDDPVMEGNANNLFPQNPVKTVRNYYEAEAMDVAIWTQDQAWAFALTDRAYTAVRPRDLGGSLMFAYVIPPNWDGFLRYVNYWLRLQRDSGFHDRMVDKWINADPNAERGPRWSILRNVLGVGMP